MALKVLIVDDDMVMRTSLKTLIDWENNGYVICGDVANGSAAIAFMNKCQPDIVITDMNMPVMDGVALREYLQRNMPHVKIIALSGYDDFDYVRKSMKCGAVDYLLKHRLNSKTLLEALYTARAAIMEEKNSKTNKEAINKQLVEGMDVLRQHFIKQLALGGISEENEIAGKIRELDMKLETQNLVLAVAEVDDFQLVQEKLSVKEVNKLVASILDIITEILKDFERAAAAHMMDGRFVIIFSFGNIRRESLMYEQSIGIIERIRVSIKRYLNITACFSVSRVFHNITETSKIYNDTAAALQNKFFIGKDRIIQKNIQRQSNDEYITLDIEDEKSIVTAVKTLNYSELEQRISLIFQRISDRNRSYKSVHMICAELINIINRVAMELGIDVKLLYSDEEIPYEKMKKYETLEEVEQWINNVYNRLISLIQIFNINPEFTESTKKAMLYIHKNYASNISLSDAAEHLGLNPSYLSRVFKKDCGVGFVEYLNMVRIEHAKWLIEKGGIKLKDIVSEVGFNNYTYFFKIFRKMNKMTPLEYEGKCRVKQG